MRIKLTVAPTTEPISMSALTLHLRIDDDAMVENELLETILKAAREVVEDNTRRALFTQTFEYYLQEWPSARYIKLPFGNLQSITSVVYKPSDWETVADNETLVENTDFVKETNGEGLGSIVLLPNKYWPSDVLYPSNPITITFVCGWTTRALIPSKVKTAIKMICADLYENREWQAYSAVSTSAYVLNKTVERLLLNARLWDEF